MQRRDQLTADRDAVRAMSERLREWNVTTKDGSPLERAIFEALADAGMLLDSLGAVRDNLRRG